jgi:hypothetical protein
MPDDPCNDVRTRLVLGETDAVSGHLASCPACRREAEILHLLVAALREDAVVTPPERLDRTIRSRLEGTAAPGLRAIGVACGGLLALICGTGILLAERGLAERGVLAAASVAAVYLAVSAAAALPILLKHGALAPSEVRR